jgi:hypothetical protein
MGFVNQAVRGKTEGSPRTGRTRACRQRGQGPLGAKSAVKDLQETAWSYPAPVTLTEALLGPLRTGAAAARPLITF